MEGDHIATMDGGGVEKLPEKSTKKMKVLCLHGFRTSGAFFKKQINRWDPSILHNFDMVYPDGIFPATGKSEIEGLFPPPYFEWFQYNKEFTEYTNLEQCISYLCDYIETNGPFDGFLGFSQGATLSALLLGYQAQGVVLKNHPPIKFLISISGCKFRTADICDIAYKDPIKTKSFHFIGDKDWLRVPNEDLLTAFIDPLLVRHPNGHMVPRLDEIAAEKMKNFVESVIASNVEKSQNGSGEGISNGVKKELESTKRTASETVEELPQKGELGTIEVANGKTNGEVTLFIGIPKEEVLENEMRNEETIFA